MRSQIDILLREGTCPIPLTEISKMDLPSRMEVRDEKGIIIPIQPKNAAAWTLCSVLCGAMIDIHNGARRFRIDHRSELGFALAEWFRSSHEDLAFAVKDQNTYEKYSETIRREFLAHLRKLFAVPDIANGGPKYKKVEKEFDFLFNYSAIFQYFVVHYAFYDVAFYQLPTHGLSDIPNTLCANLHGLTVNLIEYAERPKKSNSSLRLYSDFLYVRSPYRYFKPIPIRFNLGPLNWSENTVETKMHWALDNPGLYTIEELQQIQEEYDAACKAMDEYLRADFRSMSETTQKRMLQLLAADNTNTPSFWLDILRPPAKAHPFMEYRGRPEPCQFWFHREKN